MSDIPAVVDNESASRFEVTVDGHLAELDYARSGGRLVLVRTLVPDELEGRGVGGALVRAAVESAAQRGLVVVPDCPFARAWLERHPDDAATVKVQY